jgi:hypothetical protein
MCSLELSALAADAAGELEEGKEEEEREKDMMSEMYTCKGSGAKISKKKGEEEKLKRRERRERKGRAASGVGGGRGPGCPWA